MTATGNTSGDYISHHLPSYRVNDDGKDKAFEVLRFTHSDNPKCSKGMATSRIIAAVLITIGHIVSLYCIYDMIYNLSGWMAFKWFLATVVMYSITGTMGITAGVHRFWSHRSYRANLPARLVLGLMNTFANQGSIIHWSAEHRVHHIHVDTDADPHNASRGLFFSHMGWLYSPRTDDFVKARKALDLSDLYNDPVAYYQDKYYLQLSTFICFIVPSIMGYYFASDALRGLYYLGFFRWVMTLHVTWNVNSLAHYGDDRPYRPEELACESLFVSIFSGGEGWHNYHHAFPWDYTACDNSNPDIYFRFNLARFWIDCFAALGWVTDRKVMRNAKYVNAHSASESDATVM